MNILAGLEMQLVPRFTTYGASGHVIWIGLIEGGWVLDFRMRDHTGCAKALLVAAAILETDSIWNLTIIAWHFSFCVCRSISDNR